MARACSCSASRISKLADGTTRSKYGKASGKVLVSSAQVGKWGAPTYDLWIVRKDFAEKHPEFLTQFVKVTGAAYAKYNADPKGYAANNANVDKIARLTGAIRFTSGADRDRLRTHLLDLFEVVGPDDPAVSRARIDLANALF